MLLPTFSRFRRILKMIMITKTRLRHIMLTEMRYSLINAEETANPTTGECMVPKSVFRIPDLIKNLKRRQALKSIVEDTRVFQRSR